MAKNWVKFTFGEVEINEEVKKNTLYASTTRYDRLKYEDLVKDGDDLAAQKAQREENLVQAYESKKLKSERLIKEAQAILKKRESKAKKQNKE